MMMDIVKNKIIYNNIVNKPCYIVKKPRAQANLDGRSVRILQYNAHRIKLMN